MSGVDDAGAFFVKAVVALCLVPWVRSHYRPRLIDLGNTSPFLVDLRNTML